MSEERCPTCDRVKCLPARYAAEDANRENSTPNTRYAVTQAIDDCDTHAVDWRQRALTAEAALAEARRTLSSRGFCGDGNLAAMISRALDEAGPEYHAPRVAELTKAIDDCDRAFPPHMEGTLAERVSNLTADRDRLTRERDEARAERDSLAADRATVEWRIAEYMGERNEARAGRDAALKAEDILVGLLNSVTDQRDELRADRDRLVGEVERANEKLAAWAGEVAKLSADKHALRAVVDAADKQNDAYKVMDASRPATGDGGSESFWREHDAYLAACDDTCAAVYEWRRNTGEKKT